MAFCIKCGAPLNEGTKFCTKCGQAVTASQQQLVYNQPANKINTNIGTQSGPVNAWPSVQKKDSTNDTILFVWAILFFVLTAANQLILFRLNNSYHDYSKIELIKWANFILVACANFSYLLIPIAIKKLPLKIISFILFLTIAICYTYLNFNLIFR